MRLPQLDSTNASLPNESARQVFAGIGKTARFLEVVFLFLSGLFAIVMVVLVVASIGNALVASSYSAADALGAAFAIASFCIYAAVFFIAALVFGSVAHGETPFTMTQARRIRIIAWLLLACSLLESFAPMGISALGKVGEGFVVADHHASLSLSVEIGPLLFAIVFFFLSSVFAYGVKLQELSDDTV